MMRKIIKIAVVTLLLASIIVPVNTTVAYTQEDIVWTYKPPLTSNQGDSLQIGDYVYHCLNEGNRIVKINADTGAEVDYIQNFTYPSKLVASSDGEFLYIATNENPDGSVGKIDLSTFGVAPTEGVVWEKNGILGTQALDIDIDDNDEWLYVADYVNQTVNKINASTGDEAGGNFPVSYGTRTRTSVYYNGSIYVGLKDTAGVAKLNPDGTKNETDFPYTTGIQDDITNIVVNETERYLYVGTLGNEYHVITENATQIHENDCNGKVTDITLDNENGVVYHSTDNDNTNLICEKQSDWSEVFNIEVSKANTGTTFISLSTNLTYIYCNNETGNLSAVYTGYASESEAETDPVNSNPSPSNGATDVSINLDTYSVNISDPNGDNMHTYLYSNNTLDGSWFSWKNSSGLSNGTVTWLYSHDGYGNFIGMGSGDLNYSQKYWWSANTTDGNGNWDNDTYSFTTGSEPPNPSITIKVDSNITKVSDGCTYALINYSIWVNNTGNTILRNVTINATKFNCSCHDFNETNLTYSNLSRTNFTNYSCYRNISIGNMSASQTFHLIYEVNISNCSGITYGTLNQQHYVDCNTPNTDDTAITTITWGNIPKDAGVGVVAISVAFVWIIIFLTVISLFIGLFTKFL